MNNNCNRRLVPRELITVRDKEDVMKFLESRIVQKDNQGIRGIMYSLGLNGYNPLDIIRKTKGMDLNDCIWITDNKNEDYYEVHIRENPSKYIKKICL